MLSYWRVRARCFLVLPLLFANTHARTAPLDLASDPSVAVGQSFDLPTLKKPEGLRPCCAFGYNLGAEISGAPIPFYRLDNIVESGNLGTHRYNDSVIRGLTTMVGGGSEKNGIIYTTQGGFIDTAHVRDSMDMTYWVASQLIHPPPGAATISLSDELARRQLVIHPNQLPSDPNQAYSVAVWTAARVAFDLAAWHEIAQWYGFQSVAGFPEGVSAFSPEDLYSNLLGVRLAASLLLAGKATDLDQYNQQATQALTQALNALGAVPRQGTAAQFDRIDGQWWDSQRRVPNKWLVRHRNYLTDNHRQPTPIPGQPAANYRLSLPQQVAGVNLDEVAALQLLPGRSSGQLPPFNSRLTRADFSRLAQQAQRSDSEARPATTPPRASPHRQTGDDR